MKSFLQKLQYRLELIWLVFSEDFRKTYTANICKHSTKLKGRILSTEDDFVMGMPFSTDGNPDYCLECIGKMSIQCTWCGKRIRIGKPVTLCAPRDEATFKAPPYAVRYHEDEKHFVGCLRWECADSGIDRAGFWMPPGLVIRVPSPIETFLAGNLGGDNEGVLIIEDLSNPNDLGKIVQS